MHRKMDLASQASGERLWVSTSENQRERRSGTMLLCSYAYDGLCWIMERDLMFDNEHHRCIDRDLQSVGLRR